MNETMYTPSKTVFLTSVDQSQYSFDINEYLDRDEMPPPINPRAHDCGLLPLPYTIDKDDPAEEGTRLNFHKLVIIGVPHVLQNNDQPHLNKAKAISFKHIYSMIKNFYQLCLSIEKTANEQEITESGKIENEGSFSMEESSRESASSQEYRHNAKYSFLFAPGRRQPTPEDQQRE